MKKNIKRARKTVARHTCHGLSRADAKKLGKITAIRTEINYRQPLANYYKYCEKKDINPDHIANKNILAAYLHFRSEIVVQKTLNQDRKAFEMIFKQKLSNIKSKKETIYFKRSYCMEEFREIITHQTEKNAFSSQLNIAS
jgi:hypothetical protein